VGGGPKVFFSRGLVETSQNPFSTMDFVEILLRCCGGFFLWWTRQSFFFDFVVLKALCI